MKVQFNSSKILKDIINVLYPAIWSYNKSMLISYHNTIKIFGMDNLWQWRQFVSVKFDTEKYKQVNNDNNDSI